jgi:hypothetical protein
MRLRPLYFILICVFCPLLAGGDRSAIQNGPTVLIKIDRGSFRNFPKWKIPGICPIQELSSGWIAYSPASSLSLLEEKGGSFEVLDTGAAGKAYYLVRARSLDQLAALQGAGNVRLLENRVFLFWSAGKEPREVLPSDLQIKRLPETAADPFQIRVAIPEHLSPRGGRELAKFSSDIGEMVTRVSPTNLLAHIENLQNFRTRYASTANAEASGAFIGDYFRGLGIPCEYDSFVFRGTHQSRNIVATLPGIISPEYTLIVCAHYDSVSDQPLVLAPGADDNGSGTAAVMEIGRVLSLYPFNFTVKLICFSAEEWGLYGSAHYAGEARKNGEKIFAVLNLDMIAYADRLPEDLDIVANPDSEWLADRFMEAARTYAPLPVAESVNPSFAWSDHSSFWDQGFSALCGIEDVVLNNPYYHKTTDTSDHVNIDFALAVTKATLAAAADLAEPVSTPPAPRGLTVRSRISSSLFSSVKTAFLNWQPSPGPIRGYNLYRTTTSHSQYQKINSALLAPLASLASLAKPAYIDHFLKPDSVYFYTVTAVSEENRESNFSQEVRDDEFNGQNP